MPALAALVAITVVWGLTFVQVKNAVAVYPVVPFLAIRFLIATLVLLPFGLRRAGSIGRSGLGAAVIAGTLLAAGYTLQTLGLERTSVSSAGFITGMYVVLTPVIRSLRTPSPTATAETRASSSKESSSRRSRKR